MTSRSESQAAPGDAARNRLRGYRSMYLNYLAAPASEKDWMHRALFDAEEELISALVAHADGAEVERLAIEVRDLADRLAGASERLLDAIYRAGVEHAAREAS